MKLLFLHATTLELPPTLYYCTLTPQATPPPPPPLAIISLPPPVL